MNWDWSLFIAWTLLLLIVGFSGLVGFAVGKWALHKLFGPPDPPPGRHRHTSRSGDF